MKNKIKKIAAFLLTILMVANNCPFSVLAENTGEYDGQLGLQSNPRPHYIDIQLEEGQDSITLQAIAEAAGEAYTSGLSMYYQSPDTIGFKDNYQTLTNLSSIPSGSTGSISIYDWAANDGNGEWAIFVTFIPPVEKKYYAVTETGTVSLAAILDAAGVTVSTYDTYYLIQDDSSADYSAVSPSNLDHTVTFNSTDLPEAGLRYRLNANGGEPCPFKLVFIGDNAPQNANDGIFTYALDQASGTATITGFVSSLSDADKANITIPATMTWPKNGGTEYTVTGIANNTFQGDTNIETVTIVSPVFKIGNYAFYECSNLTEVHQTQGGSGSKLTVGEHVFDAESYKNSKLRSFTSEAGIDKIGDKAFAFTDKLETFTAGSSQKTWIGTNAFQNCTGELFFDGGISYLGYLSFYNTKISKITTIAIDDAWYSIWEPLSSQIDLVLNVSNITNGTLTDSVLTDNLLKFVSGFNNITVNLKQGVTAVSADAFSSFDFDSYDSLTVNIDTEENDAEITVVDDAIPADQTKLQVNFRVPRENVTGADTAPLPTLEAVGRVTYLDAAPADTRVHDDLFWYEIEDGKATIIGIYDETATALTFTSANQGNVYTADGTLMENISLNVAGIASLSDAEKAAITSVTFNSSSAFTVADDALNEMPALETLTLSNANVGLPEDAFSGCTALETVTIGTSENQTGSFTIPAGTFDGCTAMTSFTCNMNAVTVEDGAFSGCAALETVSFTGKGSQNIKSGAFEDATGIKHLRIDNPYDVASGAFAVTNGTAFVQNNDSPLNDNLASKIGGFNNYIFINNPWWMNSNAFSGNYVPTTIYFANSAKNLSRDLVSAIQNAGSNLTDVYIDCAREDVSFADELDTSNPNVTIHYRENNIYTGLYVDGVNGNDEGDGSKDNPFKTFDKVKEALASIPEGGVTTVEDDTVSTLLADACPKVGVSATPGTFTDYVEMAKQAFVLNTVTVSGTETWDGGDSDPVILIRDPSFTGALVNVTGSLTLKNVALDGNRTNVTADASLINAQSGSTLTLDSGSVLRNNASPVAAWINSEWENGGAVFAKGATVNIKNGSLIDNNLAMYGGGVQMYGGTLNMTGGTVSNNTAEARKYNSLPVQGGGGGVILTHGAVMNLSGGTITGNYAKGYEYNSTIGVNGSTGGGIQVGASYNDLNSESKLNMTGGTVSNNTARAEGGGICIQDSCTATITAGQIINNQSLVDGGYVDSFGGGGIYVNAARAGTRNGLLKLNNALITDNEAYSGGGGIACCETVNLTLAMGNGAAIFGNHITGRSGEHDLLLFYRGYGSSPGTKAKLAFYMMNGAEYNWTHVVTQYDKDVYDCPFENGEPVSEELIAYVNVGSVGCDLKLKSNPSNTSVNPKVIITGNKANAKGGGIGSNGNIVIGDAPPSNDVTMTPEVSKLVVGRDMKEGEVFNFTVYREEWTNAFTGGYNKYTYTDTVIGQGTLTMGEDNVPALIDLPGYTVSNVGSESLGNKYTLLVTEDTESSATLAADDQTYFALHYVIGQGKDAQGKSCYKAYLYKIEKGQYTRAQDGTPEFEYGEEYIPGYVEFMRRLRTEIEAEDLVFTNYPLDRDASAEKLWQDENGNAITPVDGVTVTFELFADGQPAKDTDGNDVQSVTLDGDADDEGEDEAWKAVWKDLPVFSDTDHTVRIAYTVKETACTSDIYVCVDDEVDVPANDTAQIINVYYETEATVIKVWDDADDQDGKRPESLKVTLSNGQFVTLNDDNNWTDTIGHLPKYKNGVEITYTWTEDTLPDGYELTDTSVAGKITTLTNSHTPEETEATVKKVWDDADDQDGKRPDSLKVTLSNGTEVTLSESNGWTATVEHLPKYKDHGTEITYTWTEDALPDGYELTDTSVDGKITTLTNSYTPEETEATVKKVWNDTNNQDGKRPESLKVTLSNGTEVTLSEGNGWTATVEHLPKYRDHGTEITYTWTEDALPEGYELTDTSVDGKITTLTNSLKPEETEATVVKVWDDMDNLDNIRPVSLTVTLSNGTDVVLNKDNEWKATVTGLPKYDNGQEIEYTWTEKDLPDGYRLKSSKTEGTVTTLTNTHNPPLIVSTSVNKRWNDEDNMDGSRPETLTVTLLANGEAQKTFVLSEENNWYAEETDLPRLDTAGKQIVYSWKEETVPGYVDTAIVNGTHTEFINTHKPEMTSVTVMKIWNDKDNELGKRPASIAMTLSNGTIVILNDRNDWKATVSNLPTYDHGKKIEYSWTEQNVVDYVQTDKTVKGNTTTFTNSIYTTPKDPPPGGPPKYPGPPTEYIPDYDTPLGVEVPVNHVGDCFD